MWVRTYINCSADYIRGPLMWKLQNRRFCAGSMFGGRPLPGQGVCPALNLERPRAVTDLCLGKLSGTDLVVLALVAASSLRRV